MCRPQGQSPRANIYDQYRYVVFKDPNWDWKTFDFDKDIVRGDLPENLIDERHGSEHAAVLLARRQDHHVPRLERFERAGGEHDQVLRGKSWGKWAARRRPWNTCGSSWRRAGATAAAGEGPDTFDTVKALEDWVERGKAPARLEASHSTNGRVDRTRPLCPYPQVARDADTGSIDDAANFVCKAP